MRKLSNFTCMLISLCKGKISLRNLAEKDVKHRQDTSVNFKM